MANYTEEVSFTEAVSSAQDEISKRSVVTEVSSVWAPVIIGDRNLAKGIAEEMAQLINKSGIEITEDELQRLVDFGSAIGALSLRKLFTPFVSDEIWVDYREGSNLTQEDALCRVRKGVGHPHGARVISSSALNEQS